MATARFGGLPDPEWYAEHALRHAEPGDGGARTAVGPARAWQATWDTRAERLAREWPALAPIALKQGFIVRSRQFAELGVPRHVVRRLVSTGYWSSPQRGAVALVRAERTTDFAARRAIHALACAAAAVLNEHDVVAYESAAVLHGLPTLDVPAVPRLAVDKAVGSHRARSSHVAADETTTWFGIPLTGPARTVVDLARHDRRTGLLTADAALRERLCTRLELDEALRRAQRWRGVQQARAVIAFADPRSESPLESLVRLRLHDDGFPAPKLQHQIEVPGRFQPYRVDFCWPDQRLVLEADGRVKYSDRELWREKRRESELRLVGYRIERVLWSDVMHDWSRFSALLGHYWRYDSRPAR